MPTTKEAVNKYTAAIIAVKVMIKRKLKIIHNINYITLKYIMKSIFW